MHTQKNALVPTSWEGVMADDIAKIRRANLKALVDQHGGVGALARKLGHKGPSYLSQLAGSGKQVRKIGEKTARDIEEKLGLERWSLDKPPGGRIPFAGTDRELIAQVIIAVGEELERARLTLPPQRQARLVAEVYEHSAPLGKIDLDYLKRLISLLA